ncbi:peptidoglycan recognition protein-like isoform X3 [Leptidea sinapis]|uniref:peptidoglycan recognition protein-like isoform X3 n=1 Tax=Leptidea sinapis TaxID=189913 RepID=UPI0021C2F446|nr:peptidoglycan recognition protein-like isoform X3 [Leptidea sinapis]
MWNRKDLAVSEVNQCNGTVNPVLVMDDRVIASTSAAIAATPQIENLNITNSTKCHVGPKFVSVTQNVHNTEMIRGRILGLELVSPRRLRCSIVVFACWAFVIALGLAGYLIYVALQTHQTRLDIGLKEPWYLRREDWYAMPAYYNEFLNLPLPYVIIGHSVTRYCDEKYACIKVMIDIQQDHLRRMLLDIGPNFLVGGNGYVFEGRGANLFGAMIPAYNRRCISIMFIGNYIYDSPDDKQFNHLNILLERLVEVGVLRPDYTLYGQCQVQSLTVPPGPNVVASLSRFTHWDPVNVTGCIR